MFVKIGVDEETKRWVTKEIFVYQTLNKARFEYTPTLLSVNEDNTTMAIEYLSNASFENTWNKEKIDALIVARSELKKCNKLFDKDSLYMKDPYIVNLSDKWSKLLSEQSVKKINDIATHLGADISFSLSQITEYASEYANHTLCSDTLVHQDIRADNFAYNPQTKSGKFIDWNWLCYGDDSLDLTPAFINIYLSGIDPFVLHPQAYDRKIILFLISFWLYAIASGNLRPDQHEQKRRLAQIAQLKICLKLLERNIKV